MNAVAASCCGFVGGDANQWQPNLFRNTTQIYPFKGQEGKWNLVTAMADEAIDYMTRIHQTDPSKPIFIKYAPGATHAPHHPTKAWVDKISAMHLFDEGWNKVRERIFANQKKLGVIPQDTQLEPWPTNVIKNWDDCTPEEKKLFIRQVDIFAAFAAYNDHEIGRIIRGYAADGATAVANALIRAIDSVREPHQDNATVLVVKVAGRLQRQIRHCPDVGFCGCFLNALNVHGSILSLSGSLLCRCSAAPVGGAGCGGCYI